MTPTSYLLPKLSDESVTLEDRIDNILRIEKLIIHLERTTIANSIDVKELKNFHFIELFRAYLMTMVAVEQTNGRDRVEKISKWAISMRTGHSIAEWILDSYCTCDCNEFLTNTSKFRNNFDDLLDIIRYYNKIVPVVNAIRKERKHAALHEVINKSYIFKYLSSVTYVPNRDLFYFAYTIKDALYGNTIKYVDNILSFIQNVPLVSKGVFSARTIDQRMDYATSLRRMRGICPPENITQLMDAITMEESRASAMGFFIDMTNIVIPDNVKFEAHVGDYLCLLENYLSYVKDSPLYPDIADLIRFYNMKVPMFKDDFTEITPDVLKYEFSDEYEDNPGIFEYLTSQVRIDTIEEIIRS